MRHDMAHVVFHDLPPEDTYCQIVDALQALHTTAEAIFSKVQEDVQEKRGWALCSMLRLFLLMRRCLFCFACVLFMIKKDAFLTRKSITSGVVSTQEACRFLVTRHGCRATSQASGAAERLASIHRRLEALQAKLASLEAGGPALTALASATYPAQDVLHAWTPLFPANLSTPAGAESLARCTSIFPGQAGRCLPRRLASCPPRRNVLHAWTPLSPARPSAPAGVQAPAMCHSKALMHQHRPNFQGLG